MSFFKVLQTIFHTICCSFIRKSEDFFRRMQVEKISTAKTQEIFSVLKVFTEKSKYLKDCLEDLFFMTIHFRERTNLSKIHVLPVSKCNNFVEGKNKLERSFDNFGFIYRFAIFGNLKLTNK